VFLPGILLPRMILRFFIIEMMGKNALALRQIKVTARVLDMK